MKANYSWVLSCVSVQQQVKKKRKEEAKNVFNMESRPESIFKEERGSYSAMFCKVSKHVLLHWQGWQIQP